MASMKNYDFKLNVKEIIEEIIELYLKKSIKLFSFLKSFYMKLRTYKIIELICIKRLTLHCQSRCLLFRFFFVQFYRHFF